MKQFKHFQGVYEKQSGNRTFLFTQNLAPGKKVYNERLVKEDKEYREFSHTRSKLGAALQKGVSQIGIKPGSIVLYLGASTGTTVSHVSDIVGTEGFIFAVDFAPRVVRELVFLSEQRPNIAPILADAFHPMTYVDRVSSVDVIFQDIAQRNQVEIFIRNIKLFLSNDGVALISVKARSVDVSKKPKAVFSEVKVELEKELMIVDYKPLEPFEKDHCIFVCKRKKA